MELQGFHLVNPEIRRKNGFEQTLMDDQQCHDYSSWGPIGSLVVNVSVFVLKKLHVVDVINCN